MAEKHNSEINTNTYFIFLCSFYAPMLRTGTVSDISFSGLTLGFPSFFIVRNGRIRSVNFVFAGCFSRRRMWLLGTLAKKNIAHLRAEDR
jgi:hypothetical protein